MVEILREGRHLALLQRPHGFAQSLFAREHGVRDLVGRDFRVAPHGETAHEKDDEKKYGEGRKAHQDPKKRVGRHDQT